MSSDKVSRITSRLSVGETIVHHIERMLTSNRGGGPYHQSRDALIRFFDELVAKTETRAAPAGLKEEQKGARIIGIVDTYLKGRFHIIFCSSDDGWQVGKATFVDEGSVFWSGEPARFAKGDVDRALELFDSMRPTKTTKGEG